MTIEIPAHMHPSRSFQGLIFALQRFWAERVFGRPSAKVKASRCEFEVIFLRNKATMCHGINKLTKKQAENKANFGPFEAVLERFLAIQSQLGSGR